MLRFKLTLLLVMMSAPAVHAAAPTPTPTPEPTPVPNTVDLSAFKGRYRGTSTVTLDSGAIHIGSSKTRIFQTAPNDLTLAIAASIHTAEQTISIGNRIDFTAEGVILGRNLAPGVLKNAKFSGLYTATSPHLIEFSGSYAKGKLAGRFSGIARIGHRGNFTFKFLVFPGESVVAAFVYQYTGKIPGADPGK